MSLSVSAFPETIYIPPPEPELDSTPEGSTSAKRRRIFGSIFGKDGNTIFGGRPRRGTDHSKSSKGSIVYQIDEETMPVLSISAEASYESVIDVSAPPRKQKPTLPALTVPASTSSLSPEVASKSPDLLFPPTPTAADNRNANPMKESIKALRLSRIHRPIDWARKQEDDALPPWASRGVIASFGDPEQYAGHDQEKSRTSSLTTATSASSGWSRSSRPSFSSSPSSRTSSVYWSTATTATSPASSKSRNGLLQSASSDQAPHAFPFRSPSAASDKSSGVPGSTGRTRAGSTSSDKSRGKAKAAFVLAPFTGSSQHKRSRTLSTSSPTDKLQGTLKPIPSPSVPFDLAKPRQRARTLSNSSAKGKGKAKASPKPLIFNTDSHPPVPSLPLTAIPSTSRSNTSRDRPSDIPRASSSSRSRTQGPSHTKSAPTTPARKHSDLPAPYVQRRLPSPAPVTGPSRITEASPSNAVPIHSPTPISPTRSPQFLRIPVELPAPSLRSPIPLRSLPIPPRSKTTSAMETEWANATSPQNAQLSAPSVWGPPGPSSGWDAMRSGGRHPRSRDHSADSRNEAVVVTTNAASDIWQERNVGDVITQLRGMKLR